jgi:hypothetical protein
VTLPLTPQHRLFISHYDTNEYVELREDLVTACNRLDSRSCLGKEWLVHHGSNQARSRLTAGKKPQRNWKDCPEEAKTEESSHECAPCFKQILTPPRETQLSGKDDPLDEEHRELMRLAGEDRCKGGIEVCSAHEEIGGRLFLENHPLGPIIVERGKEKSNGIVRFLSIASKGLSGDGRSPWQIIIRRLSECSKWSRGCCIAALPKFKRLS